MGFLSIGIEPSLIHGVDVVVERLDLATTLFDDVYREIQDGAAPTYLDPITVLAQVKYKAMERMAAAAGGDDAMADGYILMLRRDVDDLLGGPLKYGDKITAVDGQDFASDPLFVVELARSAIYRSSHLWKFFFSRRHRSFAAAKREEG